MENEPEIKGAFKISHRVISMEVIENLFKDRIQPSSVIDKYPVWIGAYLIHSYIDMEHRVLHLFFHDPVNGIELIEGQDLLSVPPVDAVFRSLG